MLGVIVASESHLPEVNEGAGRFASMAIWGEPDKFDKFCSVTVTDGDRPIAAVILHNWQKEAGKIELSGAGTGRWQSRRVLNLIFGLCFDVMGCQIVVMHNKASDHVAVNNSRKLGFQGQLMRRMCGRNEDQWMFTMTDDEWAHSRLNIHRKSAIVGGDAAPSKGLHDREDNQREAIPCRS